MTWLTFQEDRLRKLREEQKTAAFNMGVTDAVRVRNGKKSGEMHVGSPIMSVLC